MDHAQDHTHHQQTFLEKYIFPVDHKRIAAQYLTTGMFMGLLGGFFSYVFRSQQAHPGQAVALYGLVNANQYNALTTSHGTLMIFWFAMPVLIAAFGNFLIPLMIGADDMVFPRINRLSYQIFFLSTIVLLVSFFVPGGAFGGGWTAYPPLSSVSKFSMTPWGSTLWILAVFLEFVAFLLGGINFIVTLMNARAPGMKLYDIPIVLWTIVIASILFMASVGPLLAGGIMLIFDQVLNIGFYDPAKGGDPVLWQHLFWFFGHPEVYVVLLPAMGIVAEIITVFSRKKLFGYRTVLFTMFGTGVLSFVVWAHHQFLAGVDPRMSNLFTVTTILISIPVTEMCFVYIATLYKGSIELTTPMLFALSFLVAFLLGGVTGIFLGASGADVYLHDTYFVIAHFHYTFVPIAILAGLAGLYYWYPKMYGRMMNETLGKIHFWGTFLPFNGIFIPLFYLGAAGDQRRVYNYDAFPHTAQNLHFLREFATVSVIVMLLFQIPFLYNYFVSMFNGKIAGKNPWQANTLEWVAESPPPHGNFPVYPTVYRPPYEYSVTGRAKDFWPQNEPS